MRPDEHPSMKTSLETKLENAIAEHAMSPGSPSKQQPLTADDYKASVRQLPKPTSAQLRNFIEAVKNDGDLVQYGQPGWRAVPLLMPCEHGYPEFAAGRVERFGNLYYYVLDEHGMTIRPDNIADMSTVLPSEIIANGVTMPEKMRDPNQAEAFYAQFEQSVNRLLSQYQG